MFEKEVVAYCRRAGRELSCNHAQKSAFFRYIRKSTTEYLKENPSASFCQVEQMLGSPKDAAELYMSTLPHGTAELWERRHRRIRHLCAAAICSLLAILIGIVVFFINTNGIVFIKTSDTITYLDEGQPIPTPHPVG